MHVILSGYPTALWPHDPIDHAHEPSIGIGA